VSDGTVWLLAGLGGLIAEVLAPGVFLLWLGLAAIGTGLVAAAGYGGFRLHVVTFAVLAPLAIGAGLMLRRRRRPVLNTAASGLVGRSATVLDATDGDLRVRLGDSDWSARAVGAVPARAARVRVVGVAGTVLLVAADAD
jgi:membrane protein implicated in regulation of membrane protease activity